MYKEFKSWIKKKLHIYEVHFFLDQNNEREQSKYIW